MVPIDKDHGQVLIICDNSAINHPKAVCRTLSGGGSYGDCEGKTYLVISSTAIFVTCEKHKKVFDAPMTFDICCLKKFWKANGIPF